MDTYLTSLDFKEEGPFTLEELCARAAERLFTWDMHVLKTGEGSWLALRETPLLWPDFWAAIREHIVIEPGAPGPAGGIVILDRRGDKYYSPSVMNGVRLLNWEDHSGEPYFLEAGEDLGVMTWHEAREACASYRGGGIDGWRLPDPFALHSLGRVLQARLPGERSTETVWNWSDKESGHGDGGSQVIGVVTAENEDQYNPWAGRYENKDGPWVGRTHSFPISTPLHARPVREF
jgi:hypothetical protein